MPNESRQGDVWVHVNTAYLVKSGQFEAKCTFSGHTQILSYITGPYSSQMNVNGQR